MASKAKGRAHESRRLATGGGGQSLLSTEGVNPLNPRERLFVMAYLVDKNATKAAEAAGYSVKTARQIGCRLLTKAHIKEAVEQGITEQAKVFEVKAEEVLRGLHAVAFGDVRELVGYHRDSCRYCHGNAHRYQMKPSEQRDFEQRQARRAELQAAGQTKGLPPIPSRWVNSDGVGFDPRRPPHPNCPECFGRGVGHAYIHDTRHLSPVAQQMYAGVEESKDGIRVRLKSADKALDSLAKHTQIYEEITQVDVTVVPTEILDEIHERAMKRAAEKQAAIKGRAERLGMDVNNWRDP